MSGYVNFSVRLGADVMELLDRLAEECYCRAHKGAPCPGEDCDGCQACPSGRARSILSSIIEEMAKQERPTP